VQPSSTEHHLLPVTLPPAAKWLPYTLESTPRQDVAAPPAPPAQRASTPRIRADLSLMFSARYRHLLAISAAGACLVGLGIGMLVAALTSAR
jgi:hypothetical protein